ncbi:MAG: cellulose synthase subunit BcsC-related outer membrane protein [Acetobacter orientalis]|uniref:cellulose synthase subunit BcsC-related outer membrane protein n=1 Tax=Acetobacter orientalis TaxID=146474 RepID=UPI0039EC0FDE
MKYFAALGLGVVGFGGIAVPVSWAKPLDMPKSSSVDVGALLLQRAQYWHDHQQMDNARQTLAQAAHLSPNNPHILELQAQWAHEDNDAAGMQNALQALRARFPGTPEMQRITSKLATDDDAVIDVSEARSLAQAGETSAAAAAYRKLFPNGPSPAYAVEYYETMAGAVGYRDKGRLGLKQLVAQSPNNMDAQIAYAEVLTWRPATRNEGLQRLQQLANIHGLSDRQKTSIEHAWSEALHWLAETPESVTAYDAWLKIHPQDTDILAIRKRAELAESENAVLSRTQGYQALANDGVADADTYFSQAVAERPSDADALGGLGLVRMRQGRMQEAADLLQKATQAAPQTANKWSSALAAAQVSATYGQVKPLIQSGNYAAAKNALQKAIELDPHQAGLLTLSGDVSKKEGNISEAESWYRQALAIQPSNVGALQGLYGILRNTARSSELAQVEKQLARVSPDYAKRIEDADLLKKAENVSNLDEKIDLLRRAVANTPHDAWANLHLAQALLAAGNKAEARQTMEPMLSAQRGASSATIQAGIFFANQTHDTETVERLLQILPRQSMNADIRQISERLKFQKMVDSAPEDPQEARLYFSRMAQQSGVDKSGMRGDLMARALLKRGDAAGAVGLLRELLSRSSVPSVGQRITYAGVMIEARQPQAARRVLAGLEETSLTLDERKSLQGLRDGLAIQSADHLNEEGKRAEAYDALAPALRKGEAPAQLALSRLYQSNHNLEKALSVTRAVLLQNSDDLDARLQAIRLCVELDSMAQAREDLDLMREQAPSDPRTWVGASVVAKAAGKWSEALDALAQARILRLESIGTPIEVQEDENPFRNDNSKARATAAADPMLAAIDQEIETTGKAYAPYLDIGPVFNMRSGNGYSKLANVALPILGSIQVGGGRFNASITPVSLSSGTITQDYAQHFSGGNVAGAALKAGYDWRWLKADIGTTPLGFATTNIVGGLQFFLPLTDNLHFNFGFERRNITDSVVAYSGIKDKETGQKWGGVMKNHAQMQLAYDVDGFNLYAGTGYSYLDGKNTRTNEEYEASLGGSAVVYKDDMQEVRLGTDMMWFRFDNNQYVLPDSSANCNMVLLASITQDTSSVCNVLRQNQALLRQQYPTLYDEFSSTLFNGQVDSYGYGGYFSPQSFFSISVPVSYRGQADKWMWDTGARLGYQTYHSRAVAGLNAISQSGLIGGAHANVFYQVTPMLRFGANLEYQKAGPWNQFIAGISAHYTFLNSK